MDYFKEYDDTDPLSIEKYAKKLIGKTFAEMIAEDEHKDTAIVHESVNYVYKHEDLNHKGSLGDLVEERYFHYPNNGDSRPDFPDAGVELKVTPYKKNRNGSLSAKERLIIGMIDYFEVVNESFEESHMWQKARLILLIYYLYEANLKSRLDYRMDYVSLFTPPEQDIQIIKNDFKIITDKIRAGKAHELSEGDTMYLGAATKSATSKNRRKQPFSSIPAKPRAFSFKTSYMTYVLNHYLVPGKRTYKEESIMKDKVTDSFEDYIVETIGRYEGKSETELCQMFDIDLSKKKPKQLESMLAYRILGVNGNKAEEFEKANIVVKTIRIGNNGKIKENMSFPTFKFCDLVKEEWENSTFGNLLRETRFLFVVYRFDANGELYLKGCQFWNIPYEDLEGDVKEVWEKTKQVLIDGLRVQRIGNRNMNNLPKQSENRVSHVRPHAKDSRDTYPLPTGGEYPKQSFWLNNSYILSQLEDRLKK